MENKKQININLLLSIILLGCFVVWTIMLKTVDVQAIGANDTDIGLATLNISFFNAVGVNEIGDKLSDLLFYPIIGSALIFVLIAIIQLIKRKSVFKIDKELICALFGYLTIILFYLVFEIVIINYRPILIEGQIEASYPSSHTMISSFILLTEIYLTLYFLKGKNKILKYSIVALISLILIAVVVLRTISGMHWLSDIIGALFLSTGLYFLYVYVVGLLNGNITKE